MPGGYFFILFDGGRFFWRSCFICVRVGADSIRPQETTHFDKTT